MTPEAPTSNPTNLLADLESRQDELLRLLGELEERTKQALANLTAPAQAAAPSAASSKPALGPIVATSATSTPPSIVVAHEVIQSESEPSSRDAGEEKPARTAARSRARKAA